MIVTMLLNEEYSFHDVRYAISRRISYDTETAFVGLPQKVRLDSGTLLSRLDFPVVLDLFMKVWWMKSAALQAILQGAGPGAADLRREWQHQQAMPKAAKGVRTQIIEITLIQPVYAWIGQASPLFHKPGGAEQVYLPNLGRRAGPNRSDFARLNRTYTLPAL
jgi:hypothetical protein